MKFYLGEPERDIWMQMDMLVEAECAHVTFLPWDSCFHCETQQCSDNHGDCRALYSYFTHEQMCIDTTPASRHPLITINFALLKGFNFVTPSVKLWGEPC